jgi:hypothetical protein
MSAAPVFTVLTPSWVMNGFLTRESGVKSTIETMDKTKLQE